MNSMASSIEAEGQLFNDTIDGFFPLHVSLCHMLERNGYASAVITVQYAPIMFIPALPHDAPVPLNIKSNATGMIKTMSFCVAPDRICGMGTWQWQASDDAIDEPSAVELNAMTRLAEPAYVEGCGFARGKLPTTLLGDVLQIERGDSNTIAGRPSKSNVTKKYLWGPFKASMFHYIDSTCVMHGTSDPESINFAEGQYVSHTEVL